MDTSDQLSVSCPACESMKVHSAFVRSAFWHNDRLVVIEDVPALVCNTCGEQFYDDGTVRLIDRMRASGFPPEDAIGELRVPVFSCSSVASDEMASGEMLSDEMSSDEMSLPL
jgi:YgiT-type zinc finger domain-containing protein